MKIPYWLVRCEHDECLPKRFEYCHQEFEASADEVHELLERIEELMQLPIDGNTSMSYKSNSDGTSERYRTFSLRRSSKDKYQGLKSEDMLVVCVERLKNPDRSVYSIADEWRLSQDNNSENIETRTLYTIEQYPSGGLQGIVTEESPSDLAYHDRRMAPFDLGQLKNCLDLVYLPKSDQTEP